MSFELIGTIVFVSAVIDALRTVVVDGPYVRRLEARLKALEEKAQ